MERYSFLYNIAADALIERASDVTSHPYGKRTDLLSSDDNSCTMEFVNMRDYVNTDPVEFVYKKRRRPDGRWPWPLRLWPFPPTVVVEGIEIKSYETEELLFRMPVEGIGHYLTPGSTIRYEEGSIKVSV